MAVANRNMLCDNTRIAVKEIAGDGERKPSAVWDQRGATDYGHRQVLLKAFVWEVVTPAQVT